MEKKPLTYKEAGVDIAAGEQAIERIKKYVVSTFQKGVLQGIGHFGAMFQIPVDEYKQPVLISSVDGVGTKLKVAVMMKKHDTIGEDLVNHCVDDILTAGARPLFFLDYLAMGKMNSAVVEEILSGMVRGCKQCNCALIGGETAEMGDLYQPGEYDLAGTIVGVVEKTQIIDGSNIRPGDRLIGLKSSGLHTNGYTLARKILFEKLHYSVNDFHPQLKETIGEVLLTVHRNYFPIVYPLLHQFEIHGIAHITGGGITGNTSRILPSGLRVEIAWNAWEWPSIFTLLQQLGGVPLSDMRRTFNLGIGMVLIVPEKEMIPIQTALQKKGEESFLIGRVCWKD